MTLIIDDREWRHDAIMLKACLRRAEVRHAYDYWEAINELDRYPKGSFDRVFLDYNLGDSKYTGFDVASYMVLKGVWCPVTVISTNVFGALEIRKLLKNRGYDVTWIPAILFL